MSQSTEELISRANQCFERKVNWVDRAQLAAKMCDPMKANITEKKEDGAGVATDVYDSIGMEDSAIAAAGIQALLASPSSPWFGTEFENKEDGRDSEAKDWIQDTGEKILNTLNNSNFNQAIGEHFGDFVRLPGATMHGEEDPDDIVRFQNIPFEEVGIGLNHKGDVDEIHRRFEYTVKQMVSRWGEGPSKVGVKVWDLFKANKKDEKIKILHSNGTRYVRDVAKRDAKNMPFYSCYVDEKNQRKIEESGTLDFPFFVSRWRVNAGQDWGYSPAMIALPDLFMINEMAKTLIMGGQIAVAPPWMFPHEDYVMPMDFNAFASNYAVSQQGAAGARDWKPFPMVSGAQMPIGFELMERLDRKIHGYFYRDLFLPLLEKQATAFEVAKVIEKRMTILGAVIGGIQRSTLSPVINFTYNKLVRLPKNRQVLKPIPDSIRNGAPIKIRYVSPLAIAQNSVRLQNTESFLASVAQLTMIDPSVRHKIKWPRAVDKIADIQAIDPEILASDDEYEAGVEADREAQAQANTLAMLNSGADTASKAAKAEKDLADSKSKGKSK